MAYNGVMVSEEDQNGGRTGSGSSLDPRLLRNLIKALRADPEGVLAPAARLAARFGVSRRRMLAALRELRRRGQVDFTRGSAIRTPRPPPAPRTLERRLAAPHLREVLAEEIRSGRRPTGSALPSSARLAAERHLSNKTVLAAYGGLVTEGLVRRQGRRFIVHAQFPFAGGRASEGPPAILVLQQDLSVFQDMSGNTWSAPFPAAFFHEVAQYGVQLVPVLAIEGESGDDGLPGLPRGRRGIGRLIASLGPRYLGVLVLGQSWTYYLTQPVRRHDFAPWIELLCSYGRPVAWWDACDEIGGGFSAEFLELYRVLRRRPRVHRHFHRCHPDLRASVRTAAKTLLDAGHRRIAIVGGPYAGDDWARWRTARLIEAISGRERACTAVVPHTAGSFTAAERELLESPGVYAVRPGLSAFRSSSLRRDALVDRALRQRAKLAEKLLAFLRDEPDVTALVCLNDATARLAGQGLDTLGLRVPRDMSLVSFDGDAARMFPYNWSSVSPGFGQLGYQTFHLFQGGGADRRPGAADIASCGGLTHRGSVGLPRADRNSGKAPRLT